mgnify:CR=1 FL=1
MLMRAYENEQFTPQDEHEMSIVRETQMIIKKRKREEATFHAQCQVDHQMNIARESRLKLTEKGENSHHFSFFY